MFCNLNYFHFSCYCDALNNFKYNFILTLSNEIRVNYIYYSVNKCHSHVYGKIVQ